jgi:hypothetical protein
MLRFFSGLRSLLKFRFSNWCRTFPEASANRMSGPNPPSAGNDLLCSDLGAFMFDGLAASGGIAGFWRLVGPRRFPPPLAAIAKCVLPLVPVNAR